MCSGPPAYYNLINRQAGLLLNPPSKEQPGFSVVCALLLCDSASYVEDHKPIDVYTSNIIPIGI